MAAASAQTLVVKLRRHLLAVALGLVVVDPELRLLLVERVGDLLHRRRALVLVGVHAGDAAVIPIVLEVDGVARQHHRAGFRQFHQQRLVSRRVAGRRQDGHAAVAEHVLVTREQLDRMRGLEARFVVGAGPVIFGLLHVEHGLREQLDIAGVVGMRMRHRHRLDVIRLEAELFELGGQRLRPAPGDGLGIGGDKAIRHGGDSIGDAGVPQEPALAAVLDEIAAVDEIHRLALVQAGRPARDVPGGALPAIEDVELFDARFLGLRDGRVAGQSQRGDGESKLDPGHHPWFLLQRPVWLRPRINPGRAAEFRFGRSHQCGQVSTSTVTWLRPFSPASRFL